MPKVIVVVLIMLSFVNPGNSDVKQLQVSPPILKDLAVFKLRTDVPSTHHTRHSFEHLLNIGFEKSGHRSLT